MVRQFLLKFKDGELLCDINDGFPMNCTTYSDYYTFISETNQDTDEIIEWVHRDYSVKFAELLYKDDTSHYYTNDELFIDYMKFIDYKPKYMYIFIYDHRFSMSDNIIIFANDEEEMLIELVKEIQINVYVDCNKKEYAIDGIDSTNILDIQCNEIYEDDYYSVPIGYGLDNPHQSNFYSLNLSLYEKRKQIFDNICKSKACRGYRFFGKYREFDNKGDITKNDIELLMLKSKIINSARERLRVKD